MMQPCLTETQQTLAALLEAMEAEAVRVARQDREQRCEPRRPLHARCELWVFCSTDEPLVVREAVARNITFLGLSVVAALPEPVASGRPVEVVVKAADHSHTYIAGTVVFCRRVDDHCHEIGISVKAAGCAPIIMNDMASARTVYDWFAAAMDTP